MFSYVNIKSKITVIEQIRQTYSKDITAIDIIDKMDASTELQLHIINSNDVYLPIVDICYLTISESGAFVVYDPFLSNLNYMEKHYRKNVVDSIAKKIMDALVEHKNEV